MAATSVTALVATSASDELRAQARAGAGASAHSPSR